MSFDRDFLEMLPGQGVSALVQQLTFILASIVVTVNKVEPRYEAGFSTASITSPHAWIVSFAVKAAVLSGRRDRLTIGQAARKS